MFNRRTKPQFDRTLVRWFVQTCLVLLWARSAALHAGPISVPNGSFESPKVFVLVSTVFNSWQRTPQPAWWDENVTGPWTNETGIFPNPSPSQAGYIDNCHSNQAAWLFAVPDCGLFQDYDSMDWNDPAPSHAFDAKFQVGNAYRLQVGLIVGTSAGIPMQEGVTLDLSLYYRDASSNRICVATTVVTNSSTVFSNGNHFLDFEVNVPTVRAGDAWAGQNIGILFLSTVTHEMAGGYWDLDNVRLTSISAPILTNPIHSSGQLQFTLQSEPGAVCEVLASTNPLLLASQWTSIGLVTNVTGSIPFIDTSTNFDQRFYQARLLP